MNVKIAPVKLSDFNEIHRIEENIFTDPYPQELIVQDFATNPYSHYFKLVHGIEIIGYAAVWVIFEDAQIVTFGVDKPYQGEGLGKLFLKCIMDFFKEKGCERVTLEVRVSNHKAIRLYQSFGFVKSAMRKNYYENGEDAYLMLYEFPKV